jgi:hypothetical protein
LSFRPPNPEHIFVLPFYALSGKALETAFQLTINNFDLMMEFLDVLRWLLSVSLPIIRNSFGSLRRPAVASLTAMHSVDGNER